MSRTWNEARKVLCIRLDNMGDVLMCTPAMRALRASLPGRRLSLLASGSGRALAPFLAEVDEVIEYAAPWVKSSPPHEIVHDLSMVQGLHERGFDAAVIFTTFSQSPLPAAMLCYLAGIPLRLAHCRENPYQMLTDWLPETEPQQGIRHEVRRQLELVAAVGAHTDDERLDFAVPASDMQSVRLRLQEAGIGPAQPWILLHPGATAASRRYPPGHWSQVIEQLHRRLGVRMLLSGDAGEAELIAGIIRRANLPEGEVQSLAGELSLGQLGAAISLADVFVSNNTGPAHMAAALGTPIVDLYALTNPQHTPWQVESRVLSFDVPCRNCFKSVCPQGHHNCLAKVAPTAVVEAVESLLRLPPAKPDAAATAFQVQAA